MKVAHPNARVKTLDRPIETVTLSSKGMEALSSKGTHDSFKGRGSVKETYSKSLLEAYQDVKTTSLEEDFKTSGKWDNYPRDKDGYPIVACEICAANGKSARAVQTFQGKPVCGPHFDEITKAIQEKVRRGDDPRYATSDEWKSLRPSFEWEEGSRKSYLKARLGSVTIGYILIEHDWLGTKGDDVVGFISVKPRFQRQGLASELWKRAKERYPYLRHSAIDTNDGQAWKRSLAAETELSGDPAKAPKALNIIYEVGPEDEFGPPVVWLRGKGTSTVKGFLKDNGFIWNKGQHAYQHHLDAIDREELIGVLTGAGFNVQPQKTAKGEYGDAEGWIEDCDECDPPGADHYDWEGHVVQGKRASEFTDKAKQLPYTEWDDFELPPNTTLVRADSRRARDYLTRLLGEEHSQSYYSFRREGIFFICPNDKLEEALAIKGVKRSRPTPDMMQHWKATKEGASDAEEDSDSDAQGRDKDSDEEDSSDTETKANYTCQTCGETFELIGEYERHQREHGKDNSNNKPGDYGTDQSKPSYPGDRGLDQGQVLTARKLSQDERAKVQQNRNDVLGTYFNVFSCMELAALNAAEIPGWRMVTGNYTGPDASGAFERMVGGIPFQGRYSHAWNALDDGTIVDTNADQFDDSEPVRVIPPGDSRQAWYQGDGGRYAMADRSGIPEVDKLIEAFLKQPGIKDYCDPENAHGACQEVTGEFVDFAKARGFKAYETNTDLEEMGYKPSIEPFGEVGFNEKGEMQYGFYPEHTIATIVLDDPDYPWGREVYIDWTATQYGYKDFPKVEAKKASEELEKDLETAVPVDEDEDGEESTQEASEETSLDGDTFCPFCQKNTFQRDIEGGKICQQCGNPTHLDEGSPAEERRQKASAVLPSFRSHGREAARFLGLPSELWKFMETNSIGLVLQEAPGAEATGPFAEYGVKGGYDWANNDVLILALNKFDREAALYVVLHELGHMVQDMREDDKPRMPDALFRHGPDFDANLAFFYEGDAWDISKALAKMVGKDWPALASRFHALAISTYAKASSFAACGVCKLRFPSNDALVEHVKDNHAHLLAKVAARTECFNCGYIFPRPLNEVEDCPLCGIPLLTYPDEPPRERIPVTARWDEQLHPRDESGKFTEGPDSNKGPKGKEPRKKKPPKPNEFPKTKERTTPKSFKEATQELHEMAKKREPKITANINRIAMAVGGEAIGLEYRLKSPESMERKLKDRAERYGIPPEKAQGKIKDALRYTIQLHPDVYTDGVKKALEELEAAGLVPASDEFENYWGRDDDYEGINMVLKDQDGFLFELHFHTDESWETKMANHVEYEKFRTSKNPEERKRLWEIMRDRAKRVTKPLGVESLGLAKAHAFAASRAMRAARELIRVATLASGATWQEYYELMPNRVDPDVPTRYFRKIEEPGDVRFEKQSDEGWVTDNALGAHLILGELGHYPVSKDQVGHDDDEPEEEDEDEVKDEESEEEVDG